MSTAIATAAWKSYKTGVEINGWKIVEIVRKTTTKGYRTRVFTLECLDTGRRVRKSSRGITLFAEGQPIDFVEQPVVEVEPVVEAKPEPVVAVAPGEVRHANYPALLRCVAARVNVWLVGPAGSGKTSAAENVARDLGLKFYSKSVGPQTSESALLGYQDANGRTVRTLLREAFEHGGVFLLDEVDAGNPGVLVVVNNLTANDSCAFPDAVVKKHPDFVLVAGANTIGQGADRQYVGRSQIDAATLDRFANLVWDYDPGIFAVAAGVSLDALSEFPKPSAVRFEANVTTAQAEARVVEYVQTVVRAFNAAAGFGKAVRVIIGTRAAKHGAALIRQGFSVADALDACLWKGLDADTRAKIESCL
jgi:cobaltochelatase CobS